MGLDAFVRCNCWRDGKTSEPPVPRELIRVDEEGGWWGLTTDDDEWGENRVKFDEWRETACMHPQMHLVDEWVCSWGGKSYFLQALERAGIENFPVLWNKFPQSNDGQLSPRDAFSGLKELRFLREEADLGFVVELVEEVSEEIIKDQGSFAFRYRQSVVLNEEGLLVIEIESEKVLFSARRIRQIALDEKRNRWTNLDSGEIFETAWDLSIPAPWPDGNLQNEQGKCYFRLVETARWRERPMTPLDLDYIIAPLTRLFEASVEIGNPVCWS